MVRRQVAQTLGRRSCGRDGGAFCMASLPTVEQGLMLEDIDVDIYRAPQEWLWKPAGARGVYGGQVPAHQHSRTSSFRPHS